jgi:hypothetical protein
MHRVGTAGGNNATWIHHIVASLLACQHEPRLSKHGALQCCSCWQWGTQAWSKKVARMSILKYGNPAHLQQLSTINLGSGATPPATGLSQIFGELAELREQRQLANVGRPDGHGGLLFVGPRSQN